MRALIFVLLGGCTGNDYALDTGDPVDTGVPICGRVRGTEGIVLYQEAGNAIRAPLETPSVGMVATGVAGPLGDDRSYVTVVNGRVAQSVDGGCNWEDAGTLPSSEWQLVAAGARVYAFDSASGAIGRSDDLGLSWDALDADEPFLGLPTVDPANADHLRGLQSRGVVDSTDGGATWSAGNPLPVELTLAADGDGFVGAMDTLVVGGGQGAWRTTDAGATWTPIVTDAVSAIAIHPDDATVLFVISTDDTDVRTISRSDDGGATWARQVDSSQITMPDGPLLWPVPGNTLQALSAAGPVFNDNTSSNGVNLYIVTGGAGTSTKFLGGWYGIRQITFGGDRWVAAMDAAEAP